MSKQLKADLSALVQEWPVWRLVAESQDPETGLITTALARTDSDTTVKIATGRSYPTGQLTITEVLKDGRTGRVFSSKGSHVSDALDAALLSWDESDQMEGPEKSGDVCSELPAGGAEATGSSALIEALTAACSALPSHKTILLFPIDDEVALRIVLPVSAVVTGEIACRALGLEAKSVLCVSLVLTSRQIADGEMQFRSVFSCDAGDVAVAVPPSLNDAIGPLHWYYSHNFGLVLRRRHFTVSSDGIAAGSAPPSTSRSLSFFVTKFDEMLDVSRVSYVEAIYDLVVLLFNCCTSRCILCDEVHEFVGVKMGVCSKDICNFSMDQYGLGVDVLCELKKNPEVVELLVYASCAAAANSLTGKRSTFTPMCCANVGRGVVRGPRGACLHFFDEGHFGDENNKNHQLLLETIQKIPPLRVMIEQSRGTNAGLRQFLAALDPLVYPLLQWIISSNRSYIELLKPCDAVPNLGHLQFHLVTCNPQKENIFQSHKREAKKLNPRCPPSKLGWHGSSCFNWHSILRHGLRNYSGTSMMSSGQVYGKGIYLANSLRTSQAYMGHPEHPWINAEHLVASPGATPNGCTIISLCEYVDHRKHVKYHGEDIITVEDPDLVVTRFLFVFPGGLRNGVNVSANDLKSLLGDIQAT
jgi:hypothetical protein